jgi:hypothetical protein
MISGSTIVIKFAGVASDAYLQMFSGDKDDYSIGDASSYLVSRLATAGNKSELVFVAPKTGSYLMRIGYPISCGKEIGWEFQANTR